jgi:putative molybdopterin biosynthesis protein
MVLRRGQMLTSRETGLLAAIGNSQVEVFRKPKVAVISTGNEIIEPGNEIGPGLVYDSNARIISDAVTEAGGEPLEMGIAIDDVDELRAIVAESLDIADLVLLSGGTSKGEGDLTYQVVSQFDDPGIVAHGVALKPGKPICLAVTRNKPLVVLPGFPTSAIFTFHEFVAPVIQILAGQSEFDNPLTLKAELATRVNSEIGRTEYLLVGLLNQAASAEGGASIEPEPFEQSPVRLRAYPMGKGSGSVTTFSRADGFITIDRHVEMIDEGSLVEVKKIGSESRPADLVLIGSHCVGLDYLLEEMQSRGVTSKIFSVGSTAGLNAAKKGDCDIAGIHLYDPASDSYNSPFASDEVIVVEGYTRQQGIVLRADESQTTDLKLNARALVRTLASKENRLMINRNQGSGTRFLIDRLLQEFLAGVQPSGYEIQVSNHHAVCSAVAQGRADWGVAIEAVAIDHGLRFVPIEQEKFDFAIPRDRLKTKPVKEFLKLLEDPAVKRALAKKSLMISQ